MLYLVRFNVMRVGLGRYRYGLRLGRAFCLLIYFLFGFLSGIRVLFNLYVFIGFFCGNDIFWNLINDQVKQNNGFRVGG